MAIAQRIVSRIAVKVVPDTSGFYDKTKADLERIEKRLKVEVGVDLDERLASRHLKLLTAKLSKESRANPVSLAARLDVKGVENGTIKIRESIERASKDWSEVVSEKMFSQAPDMSVYDRAIDSRSRAYSDLIGGRLFGNIQWNRVDGEFRAHSNTWARNAGTSLTKEVTRSLSNAMTKTDFKVDWDTSGLADASKFKKVDSVIARKSNQWATQISREMFSKTPNMTKMDAQVKRHITNWGTDFQKVFSGNGKGINMMPMLRDVRVIRDLGSAFRTAANGSDRFGDSLGKHFGRGSRNNVLNVVGNSARLAVKPVSLLFRTFGAAGSAVTAGVNAFRQAAAVGGKLPAVLKGISAAGRSLGSAFKVAAKGGGAAALALLAMLAVVAELISVIPALGAGVSMIGGAVMSVASAGFYALAGAVLPLIPAFIALAGGIGVAVLAFSRLDKAGGPAKRALQSIKAELKGFTAAIDGVARDIAPKIAKTVSLVSGGIRKMIGDFGLAIGSIMDDLNSKLADPRIRDFISQFGTQLPAIFQSLGKAITSFGLGLIAFFQPIMPYAQRLADNIKRVADEFLRWTTSASGQNSIARFMQLAWEAASKLWGILVNVGATLGNIFKVAYITGGGRSLLDYLEDLTTKFRKWTGSDLGQEKMRAFFADVREMGSQVLQVIEKVVKKFQEWNTEANRQKFTNIIKGVGDLITKILDLIDTITTAWGKVKGFFKDLSSIGDKMGMLDPKKAVGSFLLGMTSALTGGKSGIVNAIMGMFTGLPAKTQTEGNKSGTGYKGGLTGALSGLSSMLNPLVLTPLGAFPNLFRTKGTESGTGYKSGFDLSLGGFGAFARSVVTAPFADSGAWLNPAGQNTAKGYGSGFTIGQAAALAASQALPGKMKSAYGSTGFMSRTGYDTMVGLGTGVKSGAGQAPGAVEPVPGQMKGAYGSPAFMNPLGYLTMTSLADGLTNGAEKAISIMARLPSQLKQAFGKPSLNSEGRSLGNSLAKGISSTRGSSANAATSLVEAAVSAAARRGNALYSTGYNIGIGLANGMWATYGAVAAAAAALANAAAAAARAKLAVRSPSRVMMEVGRYAAEGLALGMANNVRMVELGARDILNPLFDVGRLDLHEVGESVSESLADGLLGGLRDVRNAADAIGNAVAVDPNRLDSASRMARRTSGVVHREYAPRDTFTRNEDGTIAVAGVLELVGSKAWFKSNVNQFGPDISKAAENGNRRRRKK